MRAWTNRKIPRICVCSVCSFLFSHLMRLYPRVCPCMRAHSSILVINRTRQAYLNGHSIEITTKIEAYEMLAIF